jgi:hypothetical protein
MAPTVVVGILLCLGFGRVPNLLAEDPKNRAGTATAPEGGKVVGILTHFEYNWTKTHGPKPDTRLSLKAEGETESVDYLLALPNEAVDPKLEVALKKVCPSNTVSLEWKMSNDKRLVTKIAVLTPSKGQGVKTGVVMARDAGYVDLKGENRGDITVRYTVPWDGKAKGPKPALAKALQDLNVGDRVAVTWNADAERIWVNQVKLVSRARTK